MENSSATAHNRRVWRTPRAGRIDRLQLQSEALPPLATGEVRIRTRAVGLNFADIFALTGLYSATPEGSFIPGLEFSGVVEDLGEGVTGFKPGQAVMGCIRFGAYAERIHVPAQQLLPLPEGWGFDQGAAFPVQTLTAWYALKTLGDLQPGQTVLVHSAAGGVGLRALAICRALGARVIGSVGSEAKREFLARLGFDEVIVRDRDFAQRLRSQLNGAPLHLVLDGIGGQIQRHSFKALAPTGRLVVFGAAEFTPGRKRPRYLSTLWRYLRRPRYDVLQMISDNRSVMGFNLIWLWQEQTLFARLLEEITNLELPVPHVGHRYPFEEVFDALETLRSGASMGKVVLTLDL